MRAVVLWAAAAALFAAPAFAQGGIWADKTGRITLDLTDTGWEVLHTDAETDAKLRAIILDTFVLATEQARGRMTRSCSLQYFHDAITPQVTQAEMKAAVERHTEMAEWAVGLDKQSISTVIIERDGLAVKETDVTFLTPDTRERQRRITREFSIAAKDAVESVIMTCMVYGDVQDDVMQMRDVRRFMDRLHIRPEIG